MPEILKYLGQWWTMIVGYCYAATSPGPRWPRPCPWSPNLRPRLPSPKKTMGYSWDIHGRPPSSWNAKVIDGPRPDLVFGNWTTPSQVGAWSERSRSLMSWNNKSTKVLAVLDLQKLHLTQTTEFDSKKRARTPRFRTCGTADHAQLIWFYLKLGSPNWMAEHQFAY